MDLALRLVVAGVVMVAPTVLYLGLLRGLERLRDDALLLSLAESDDAPDDVSSAAASALKKRPIRGDDAVRPDNSVRADGSGRTDGSAWSDAAGRAPRPETVACSDCGASNMAGARYCGECLTKLTRR